MSRRVTPLSRRLARASGPRARDDATLLGSISLARMRGDQPFEEWRLGAARQDSPLLVQSALARAPDPCLPRTKGGAR
jgi:hypothetical protein